MFCLWICHSTHTHCIAKGFGLTISSCNYTLFKKMSFFILSMQGFLSISDLISPLPPSKKSLSEISSGSKFQRYVFCLYVFCFLLHFDSRRPRHFDITVEWKKHLDWKSIVGDNQMLVKVIREHLILIKYKFSKGN